MSLEEVYDLHAGKVYKFFYIKCFDRDLAEDLTSQTFMVLVERMQAEAANIEDHKKFLYGVMRNIWLMYLRKKYRQNERSTAFLEDFEEYVNGEVEEYEARTIKQRAEVFIDRLPARQKEVVSLRLLEDHSIKDIAEYLHKDRNYVKTTYKRGLKHLKELVKGEPSLVEARKEGI
jgi:RNA polymerase sigma-70 factor (ECF subfamily)